MDILRFFEVIIALMSNLLKKLATISFTDWNGGSFNYLSLIFGAFVISMVINLFWKGAKG